MIPDKDNDETQTFQCKSNSCTESVTYERETVLGLVDPANAAGRKSKVVYLTCANGHTYPYTVN